MSKPASKSSTAVKEASTQEAVSSKCEVCGAGVAAHTGDDALCWVCRRLKISAWRDSDLQSPPQE